ncbi:MAG: hypothetical protein KJ804_01475 [Proteobacteria bacterium]|nr:hypothetical protein [Pseudomonadota bacterium]
MKHKKSKWPHEMVIKFSDDQYDFLRSKKNASSYLRKLVAADMKKGDSFTVYMESLGHLPEEFLG